MLDSSERRFGKYQIERELGRGGFGTVFRAIDTTLDRPVAIKILDPLLMRDQSWVARFGREARLMARLDHPHIAQVFETGTFEGRLFIAMKLVDGPDLARFLASEGPLAWDVMLSLVGQIAGALDYAHGQGLVHRDLKPGNVLLANGQAVLTDFGLSTLVSSNTMSVSMTGGIIGTPSYIAPEVWEGREVTPRADQYALACLVYEMLTGKVLFRGESPPATMMAHYQSPQFLAEWEADIPPVIEQVLETALARDPADRYGSCGELVRALQRLQSDTLAEPYAALEAAVREAKWAEALSLAEQVRARDADYRDVAALEDAALQGQMAAQKAQIAAQWRAQAEEAAAAGNVVVARTAAHRWQELTGAAEAAAFLERLDQQEDQARLVAADAPFSDVDVAPSQAVDLPTEPTESEPEAGPSAGDAEPAKVSVRVAPVEKPALVKNRNVWLGAAGALILIIISALIINAARSPSEPVPEEVIATTPAAVEVEVTRLVEGEAVTEQVEVTRVVVETVEVEVQPEEVEAGPPAAPDPTTYWEMSFGEPDTLDPSLAWDTYSARVIENVMEGLITYDHTDATAYVPVLALEVPSLANGLISADGKTYTFNVREGITFHDGGSLEPHDIAYTFQRGLLQSDPNSAQWLLLEPLLGYTSGDVTEEITNGPFYGDRDELRADAAATELAAVCEKVKATVSADDNAGTVTFTLAQPWGPFLATLASPWGSKVLDMEWAVENGAWDGDCGTWQDWYAPGAEDSELSTIINGTGPFMLDHWTPGEEWVLVRYDDYWRQDGTPKWEGGPSGLASLAAVVYRVVNDGDTRLALLQAGDAGWASVLTDNQVQADNLVGEFCNAKTDECVINPDNPSGPLRRWDGLINPSRTDIFLNFDVADGSPFIGSGQLDGNGIPSDFFSDINVRQAFTYCFDYDMYIDEAQSGRGARNNGPIPVDMLGYNPDGEMYEYDLSRCEDLLATAHGGILPETGFRFQIPFNTGNTTRQTAASIFQTELRSINSRYQVDIVGLSWPDFLRYFRDGHLPVAVSGWIEDIHDPHSWVVPFTVGVYADRQNVDAAIQAQFQELVTAGLQAVDPAEREAVYFELQQLHHDIASQVTLSQPTGVRYEQRWVQGWYYNPAAVSPDYYALSLDGG